MNPDLERLKPYPFQRLTALKADVTPQTRQAHISLALGEPQHAVPHFISEALIAHTHGISRYPSTKGSGELRERIGEWLTRRFQLPETPDPEREILPLAGTREGLFAIAQAVVDPSQNPVVVMPNPFYQIYEGAALLAGAEAHYLNTTADNGYLPDFDSVPAEVWQRCQLLYLCSPGNPTGAVMTTTDWQRVIDLADRHDFVIAADECYSELYFDEYQPPVGILQACAELGRSDYRRCLAFHSLSKRSNAPGLRSGFVAGDGSILERFLLYRTYQGCALPMQTQAASIEAWRDEAHVRRNRAAYRTKLNAAINILGQVIDLPRPQAGFYLWAPTPIPDTDFAKGLFEQQNVTVLPGSYLSRPTEDGDPGAGHVRIALVAEPEECAEAIWRVRNYIETLS